MQTSVLLVTIHLSHARACALLYPQSGMRAPLISAWVLVFSCCCTKLHGIKQHTFMISQFCKSEVEYDSYGAQIKWSAGLHSFSQALGENSFTAHYGYWQNSVTGTVGPRSLFSSWLSAEFHSQLLEAKLHCLACGVFSPSSKPATVCSVLLMPHLSDPLLGLPLPLVDSVIRLGPRGSSSSTWIIISPH